METYKDDIDIFMSRFPNLPTEWDGKASILELKEADYQWRQMEWWAFYFEFIARRVLQEEFQIPGERFGNVTFDMLGAINWDLKSSAIRSDSHKIILNDKVAMDASVARNNFHGEIIALCDVVYNDCDRSFQKWHTELKGGLSRYETERISRTAISRYRKTKAALTQIAIVVLKFDDLEKLGIMRQGRNSSGSPGKEKYMLDMEDICDFENYIIDL